MGKSVILGDFNLDIGTESVGMFKGEGMKDLIGDCGVTNTRNENIWKKYPDSKQYYSDWAFTGNQIEVRNFQVPYNLVSDHLSLIVEI